MTSTESPYSYNTKIGSEGYDGGLLTIRANTIDELYDQATRVLAHGDLVNALNKLRLNALAGVSAGAPVSAQTAPWDQPQQPVVLHQPTHDQAVANVAAQIPVVSAQTFAAPNVTPSQAPGVMRTVPGKFEGQSWTYDVPGAPAGQFGPMIQLQGNRKDGKPYTCWAEAPEGPEWPGKPPIPFADLRALRKYSN